jgi:hypothetical protein
MAPIEDAMINPWYSRQEINDVGEFFLPCPRSALPYFNRTQLDFTDGPLSESAPAFEH